MIYVRAPTRIGPKFQVIPPPQPEARTVRHGVSYQSLLHPFYLADPELPSRGGDDTIEIMSLFSRMDENYSKRFVVLAFMNSCNLQLMTVIRGRRHYQDIQS